MKAIILAAGEGRRLASFTATSPKCLIPLEGKSILDWQIDTMRGLGISDIVVVKGYLADKITGRDVRYYTNKRYKTTNMVATLWCARDELDGDVLVAYGDIVYNAEVLEGLMKSPYGISVAVDSEWEALWRMRFKDPLEDAEALRIDDLGRIKVIGQKARSLADVQAGYIGLVRFRDKGLEAVKESFLRAYDLAECGGRPWGIDKPLEMAYMTDMLQGLVDEGCDIYATVIRGGWLEIDSERDYELARKIFVGGKIVNISEIAQARGER